MAYTEVKVRNGRKYYYRVLSVREQDKVNKKRVYLGSYLFPAVLAKKESAADALLTPQQLKKNLQPIIRKIVTILKKYHVKKAALFGSYARGEQTSKSDIDILVEPPKGMGLQFVGLALELEKRLGKKVDLVSYNGISPYLKKYILEDEQRIL